MDRTASQWASDSTFVAMYVATGMIAGMEPQSLMLIGESDEGKSSLLSRFNSTPRIYAITNTYGNDLKQEVFKRKPRHILVDEFVALLAHSDQAVDNIITFLRQVLTGDSQQEIIGQGNTRLAMDFSGYRCGLLTSITNSQYHQSDRLLSAGGFDTRLNMFRLRRSEEERKRVRELVLAEDRSELRPYHWTQWQLSRPGVIIPANVRDVFKDYTRRFFAESGNRTVTQLSMMLSSVAFLRNHTKADLSDLTWFLAFHEYWTHLGTRVKPVLSAQAWTNILEWDSEVLDFAKTHQLPFGCLNGK